MAQQTIDLSYIEDDQGRITEASIDDTADCRDAVNDMLDMIGADDVLAGLPTGTMLGVACMCMLMLDGPDAPEGDDDHSEFDAWVSRCADQIAARLTEPAQTIDVNGQPWLLDAKVADRSVILAGAMTANGHPVNWQYARVHRNRKRTASAEKRSDCGVVHVLERDELQSGWVRRTVVMFRSDEV